MSYSPQEYHKTVPTHKARSLKIFLEKCGIDYDESRDYTVILADESENIVATGSLLKNVIKFVGVDEKYRGEGLLNTLMSALISMAYSRGDNHIFVYTKPENKHMFSALNFYEVAQTDEMLLLENKRGGIESFLNSLEGGASSLDLKDKKVGGIIANCNPFTRGHYYLIEQAYEKCDVLHIFILSEDKSLFSRDVRFKLVSEGIKGLVCVGKRLFVHPTSDYLVSSATFPTYFLKEKSSGAKAACKLDLEIFCRHFVPYFKIDTRFVGHEPYCPVTRSYNEQMKEYFPKYGVKVEEIRRKEQGGEAISASLVRKLCYEGRYERVKELVPDVTYEYLISPEGKALFEKKNEDI